MPEFLVCRKGHKTKKQCFTLFEKKNPKQSSPGNFKTAVCHLGWHDLFWDQCTKQPLCCSVLRWSETQWLFVSAPLCAFKNLLHAVPWKDKIKYLQKCEGCTHFFRHFVCFKHHRWQLMDQLGSANKGNTTSAAKPLEGKWGVRRVTDDKPSLPSPHTLTHTHTSTHKQFC